MPSAWKDQYYVKVYESAREGLADAQIASALGVDRATFKKWLARLPALQDAIDKGRGSLPSRNGGQSLGDYVYQRLPRKLQKVWDGLKSAEKEPNGEVMVDELIASQGKRARQHLFLHALVLSNFNASKACKRMRMSYATFEKWKKHDPDFIELVRQVQEMKKDFCESALLGLVRQGDTAAVVFANKTLNRDRGYGLKVEVEHTGGLSHAVLDITDLVLPPEVLKQILEAVRNKKEQMLTAQSPTRVLEAHNA